MYLLPHKHSSNQSMYEALKVFLFFVYETRNTSDNVRWVWSTMALVYRNIKVTTVTIDEKAAECQHEENKLTLVTIYNGHDVQT